MAELKYRRILLKLGGEALAGEGGFGINPTPGRVCGAEGRQCRQHGHHRSRL